MLDAAVQWAADVNEPVIADHVYVAKHENTWTNKTEKNHIMKVDDDL